MTLNTMPLLLPQHQYQYKYDSQYNATTLTTTPVSI